MVQPVNHCEPTKSNRQKSLEDSDQSLLQRSPKALVKRHGVVASWEREIGNIDLEELAKRAPAFLDLSNHVSHQKFADCVTLQVYIHCIPGDAREEPMNEHVRSVSRSPSSRSARNRRQRESPTIA